MHLTYRNVNDAFRGLVSIMNGIYDPQAPNSKTRPVKRPSRNGNVFVIDEPVTVTYTNPIERVYP